MQDRHLRCGLPITGGIIARCTSCGTNQVVPRPRPEVLAELYTADYYQSFMEGPGVAGGNLEASPSLRKRLAELETRLGKGRLLDVGCGLGHFVKYAADQGWDAAGLEPSAWAAREGRKRYGIVVHIGQLDEAPIEPGSLDVVHANHVVEHLLEPVAAMEAALRLLRPGGLLVIEVPQELSYPLSDRLFRRLHPGLYRAPHPPHTHHLEFFTPRGLGTAARRAGFKVERVRTIRHLRSAESRLPAGLFAKSLLYRAEEALQMAPDIELWATRP
jgi:SAM-dependent methyltransferase